LRGWYFVNLFAVDRDSHALGGFVDIDHQSARAAWPSANSATVAAVNVAMQWLMTKLQPRSLALITFNRKSIEERSLLVTTDVLRDALFLG
jgi:hypothetical protein